MTPNFTTIEQTRGFNYSPGYAFTGADTWRRFDAATVERELGWGKQQYPKMNGLRIWLAWDLCNEPYSYAFGQNPGAMHCIEPDGSLRPGHGIINRFLEEPTS